MINLIKKLHESNYQFFFTVTGGGTEIIGEYLKRGGGSSTFLGATVPYNTKVFQSIIKDSKFDSFCSARAAQLLARFSYQQASIFCDEGKIPVGIGISASLSKGEDERIGREHKIYFSFRWEDNQEVNEVLIKQGSSREEEETFVSFITIFQLGKSLLPNIEFENTTVHPFVPQVGKNIISHRSYKKEHCHYLNLLFNETNYLTNVDKSEKDICIFPGSFNLRHIGHIEIKKMAEEITDRKVYYELSVDNASKGKLEIEDIINRVEVLKDSDYILTNSPFMRDKIRLLTRCFNTNSIIIVVGMDTFTRIFNPKYCSNFEEEKQFFRDNNVKFLVFGRNNLSLGEEGLEFVITDERALNFSMPISSSAIRAAKGLTTP